MLSIKLACFFKLFSNQRLEDFYQLLSCTSVRPSKCPIYKMINWQGYLTASGVP